MNYNVKDSGTREEFPTGSRRDSREGKGRFDLIPSQELRRLAAVYEKGAIKYGDHNWQKGQPLMRYVDSAIRHILCAVEGQEDEDHIMHAAWNCFAFAWTQKAIRDGVLPVEMDDLPTDVYAHTPDAHLNKIVKEFADAISGKILSFAQTEQQTTHFIDSKIIRHICGQCYIAGGTCKFAGEHACLGGKMEQNNP